MDFQTHVRFPSTSVHSTDSGQDEGVQGNISPGDNFLVEGSLANGAASDVSTVRYLSTGRPLPSLQKLIWLICGTPSGTKEQITPWQNSSVDPGGVLQRANAHVHGEIGQNGVGDSLYQELRQLYGSS